MQIGAGILAVVYIVVGVVLLVFGRRVFWFLAGVVGYEFGVGFIPQVMPGQPDWVHLTMALLVGFSAILVALFLSGLAFWVVGFLVGGYLLSAGIQIWGPGLKFNFWQVYLGGGVLGSLMVAAMFDWALIILSTLTGAFLILQNFNWHPLAAAVVLVVLFVVGFEIQVRMLEAERK